MKITITSNDGETVSWESEREGYSLEELVIHLKGLLVAHGYHPKTVDECLYDGSCYDWDLCKESPNDGIYTKTKELMDQVEENTKKWTSEN